MEVKFDFARHIFSNSRLVGLICLAGAWGALAPVQVQSAATKVVKDEAAQLVTDGDAFRKNDQINEALWAYTQAAKAGSPKGAFAAGAMLVSQGQDGIGRERLLKFSEGLNFLFLAATNRQAEACAAISAAYQNGVGVHTNLVNAYAWLQVAAQYAPSYKKDLDQLVIQLEPVDVQKAQQLGRDYLTGNWPPYLMRQIDRGDAKLKIQGISRVGREPLLIVNGVTVGVHDTVEVKPADKPKSTPADKLTVTCRELGSDYVLFEIAGEPRLKLMATE